MSSKRRCDRCKRPTCGGGCARVGDYAVFVQGDALTLARVTEVNRDGRVIGFDFGKGERVPQQNNSMAVIRKEAVRPGIRRLIGAKFASMEDAVSRLQKYKVSAHA